MTDYDKWLPVAKKLIAGLSAKPGVRITDKAIAADNLAQAMAGAARRGELPSSSPKGGAS